MVITINTKIDEQKILNVDGWDFKIYALDEWSCLILDPYSNVVTSYAGDINEDEENIKIIEEYLLKNPLPDINERKVGFIMNITCEGCDHCGCDRCENYSEWHR